MTDTVLVELHEVVFGILTPADSGVEIIASEAVASASVGGSGTITSVNGDTGPTVVLDADDLDDTSTTHKFVTGGDLTKLGNLSGTNTGDQDLSGKQDSLGYTAENAANKATSTSLGTSDTLYPSQKAVKTYVDAAVAAGTDVNTVYGLAFTTSILMGV